MHRWNRKYIAWSGLVVLAIAVGLLAWLGWRHYHKPQVSQPITKGQVTSYEQCTKADGSRILETYPEQCVTTTGKTFVAPGSTPKATVLVIQEWGIQLPLTSDIADAMYTMGDGGTAHITTPALTSLAAKQTGCGAGVDDIYITQSTAETKSAVHVGTHYYSQYHPIEPACVGQVDSQDSAQIHKLQASLVAAIQNVTAANPQ